MKKHIRKTHSFDETTYMSYRQKCMNEKRPVSTMLNELMKYCINSKLTTDQLLSINNKVV